MCYLSEGKVRSGKFDLWTVYTVAYAHHNVSVLYFRCILQAFYQLHQLRRLTLGDNQISHLSPDVANFEQLQEFDISHNGNSASLQLQLHLKDSQYRCSSRHSCLIICLIISRVIFICCCSSLLHLNLVTDLVGLIAWS